MSKQQSMTRKWITFIVILLVLPLFLAGIPVYLIRLIFGESFGLDIIYIIAWMSAIVWVSLREAPGLKKPTKQ